MSMNKRELRLRMAYPFLAPIIVRDPSWGVDDVISQHVIEQRILHLKEIFEEKMATEWEAFEYISNMSLTVPLDNEWARIYLKLGKRLLRDVVGIDTSKGDVFEGIDEHLTDYERGEVNRLRSWIFDRQIEVVKKKTSEMEKGEEGEEEPEEEVLNNLPESVKEKVEEEVEM